MITRSYIMLSRKEVTEAIQLWLADKKDIDPKKFDFCEFFEATTGDAMAAQVRLVEENS